MEIFKDIEKWKEEHKEEWEQIENYLKLLEEMGLKREFEPMPLLPGGTVYDIHVSKSNTLRLKS